MTILDHKYSFLYDKNRVTLCIIIIFIILSSTIVKKMAKVSPKQTMFGIFLVIFDHSYPLLASQNDFFMFKRKPKP